MYDNHITTVGVMFKTEAQTSRVDWTYIYKACYGDLKNVWE